MAIDPPLISPPTRFASMASSAAGRRDVARKDAVAKSRSVALDLRLDAFGHVDGRAIRHVAVRPEHVLSLGRAGRIEERWLRSQDERALGMPPLAHVVLARSDFFQGARRDGR